MLSRCFLLCLQKVALGSAHLEEALCLLKDAGQPPVSPILEQEIQEALVGFKPDCTLEHLKVCIRTCKSAQYHQYRQSDRAASVSIPVGPRLTGDLPNHQVLTALTAHHQ